MEPYIKEYDDNGILQVKKKVGKTYKTISIFPKESMLADYNDTPTFEQ